MTECSRDVLLYLVLAGIIGLIGFGHARASPIPPPGENIPLTSEDLVQPEYVEALAKELEKESMMKPASWWRRYKQRVLSSPSYLREEFHNNLDHIGGGHLLKRNLDAIGGGNLIRRNLDAIGGGNLIRRNLDAIGGGNLIRRNLDAIGGGNLIRRSSDNLAGNLLPSFRLQLEPEYDDYVQ